MVPRLKTVELISFAMLVCVLLHLNGCDKGKPSGTSANSSTNSSSLHTQSSVANEPNEDDWVDQQLKESRAEAAAWFKNPSHNVFEGSRQDAVEMVENFYQQGASEVLVTGIVELEDSSITASLVVVLPADQEKRRKIFETYTALIAQNGEDSATDIGQKYLYVTLE